MINKENLHKIYDGVIAGNNELKTSQLNSYGLNSRDLKKLIDNGTLKRIKRGFYSVISEKKLYDYARYLIRIKKNDEATTCFERCYEINPRYKNICFYLFFRNIQSGKFEEALKYFDVLYHINNKYQIKNNNYYLYLLSMAMILPSSYRERAQKLTLQDITLIEDNTQHGNIKEQNRIRHLVYLKKFRLAAKELEKIKQENSGYNACNILTRRLLYGIKEKQQQINNDILQLQKEGRYEEVVSYLEYIKSNSYLGLLNDSNLCLTKDLIEIKKTGIVPRQIFCPDDGYYTAIKNKNYQLALAKEIEDITSKNISPDDDYACLILTELNNIVSTLNKKTNGAKNPTIVDIAGYLMDQDFYYAFLAIHKYLEKNEKEEYQFLIEDLIRISIINDDTDFITPITTLMLIGLDKFKLNTIDYVGSFYDSLEQSRFDEASIYLDIIGKSKELNKTLLLPPKIGKLWNNINEMLDKEEVVGEGYDNHQFVEQYLQTVKKEDIIPSKTFIKGRRK